MTDESQAGRAREAEGGRWVTLVIVAALMLVEGAAVFAVTRMLAPPLPEAVAAETGVGEDDERGQLDGRAEIMLSSCRPTNRSSGRLITFQVRVCGVVPRDRLEEYEKLVSAMQARIDDRVNYVFRSAEPAHLNEPGQETLKRRLKQEFGTLFGEDYPFEDILLPEMLQSMEGV